MPIISDSELNRRRQDILIGARRAFAKYGYEGATVRILEEATGKSRGAIFHHFGDKESLFLALAREDFSRQAEIVASRGLVDVMREMLHQPEKHDWLTTRLEITSLRRTDSSFRARWDDQQQVLDEAVRKRVIMSLDIHDDRELDALVTYLQTFMEGFISRLALGQTAGLDKALDIVELSLRRL
ncbi:MAG: helix-turn-helix domain-containing protein [Corynebacterium sp.]|nr:helix-turn-helix domain-containing protein [Corynebacterium sp.]